MSGTIVSVAVALGDQVAEVIRAHRDNRAVKEYTDFHAVREEIRYCTRLFENFGLSRAPVVESRKVIGIVGYTDIVLDGVRDRLL